MSKHTDYGVNVSDVDTIQFVASVFSCMFVIVEVATNGLGYFITDVIIGDDVNKEEGPFYILVSVENFRFDSLLPRTYQNDPLCEKELVHITAINKVIHKYMGLTGGEGSESGADDGGAEASTSGAGDGGGEESAPKGDGEDEEAAPGADSSPPLSPGAASSPPSSPAPDADPSPHPSPGSGDCDESSNSSSDE